MTGKDDLGDQKFYKSTENNYCWDSLSEKRNCD